MIEFLYATLIQAGSAALGFLAGALWMRENYISVIRQLHLEIKNLKGQLCWLTQRSFWPTEL